MTITPEVRTLNPHVAAVGNTAAVMHAKIPHSTDPTSNYGDRLRHFRSLTFARGIAALNLLQQYNVAELTETQLQQRYVTAEQDLRENTFLRRNVRDRIVDSDEAHPLQDLYDAFKVASRELPHHSRAADQMVTMELAGKLAIERLENPYVILEQNTAA